MSRCARKIRYSTIKTTRKIDKWTIKHAIKTITYTSIILILISIGTIMYILPRIIELKYNFLLLGIAIISILLSFLLIQHKKSKYKFLQNNKNLIIILAITFVKILLISEIIKLVFFYNFSFLDSLGHIKTLGYTLGSIIAISGVYISYRRVCNTEKQHNKTLKETKFKNAVELLSKETRTSRLLGVQSLCELTQKHKELKFLESNIEILMLHLEDIYNLENQDVSESNRTTSPEIKLTLEHITTLLNKIKPNTPANKLYILNIPLYNVRFDQELNNVYFLQELHNVDFIKKLHNVYFYNKLNNVYFFQELNNVCFSQELNNVYYHKSLVENLIAKYIENLSNNNYTVSITINNYDALNPAMVITNNVTEELNLTFEITKDGYTYNYNKRLSYNVRFDIVYAELIDHNKDSNIYNTHELNNDIKNSQS